ncbi:unnamed protein product, partial [Mesorhabditis spiculigera]
MRLPVPIIAKLKRAHPLDEGLASGLYDETDLIFMQSKKMLTAAALGASSSGASAGATSPATTPVSLLQQNLLPYSSAAQLAAMQPIYQQMALQQQLQAQLPGAGAAQPGGYEGIPIFIVNQQAGTNSVSMAALQKAAEIQATILANAAQEPKVDTSKHHHVFVGDLSPEVTNNMLKDAFAGYGEISEAKVIRDSQTQKSKGYGFVSFPIKEHAEKAMTAMNGQWIGKRAVRTNWAARKPQDENRNTLTFEQVFNSTKADNTSVYVGNISQATTEESLREPFSAYGEISEIRMFKAQGYAFVRYDRKEDATKAIMEMNGKEVAGQLVRCSWGRTQQAQVQTQATPLLSDLGSSLLTSPLLQPQLGLQQLTSAAAASQYLPFYPQYYGGAGLLPQWPQV